MRVRRVGLLSLLATLAVVHQAAAQETSAQELRLVDNGEPMVGVQISGLLNRINKPVGTTDEEGDIDIPDDAFDFVKGDRVAVWVVECKDGEVVKVILIREEEGDPCTQEGARPGEGCGCRRIGSFIWGEGPVTVDTGTGRVTRTRLMGVRPTVFKIGLGAGSSFWPDLEDAVCDQEGLTECETESTAVTFQGFAGFRPGVLRGLGFGADFTYTPFGTFTQRFDGDVANEIDFDVFTAGGYVDYGIPVGQRLWLVPMFGFAWVWNMADITADSQSDERSESGGRVFGKLALDIPLGYSGYGIRLEFGHMRGEGDDADNHTFVGLKFFKLFGLNDEIME
jgi:hypothetical protein